MDGARPEDDPSRGSVRALNFINSESSTNKIEKQPTGTFLPCREPHVGKDMKFKLQEIPILFNDKEISQQSGDQPQGTNSNNAGGTGEIDDLALNSSRQISATDFNKKKHVSRNGAIDKTKQETDFLEGSSSRNLEVDK